MKRMLTAILCCALLATAFVAAHAKANPGPDPGGPYGGADTYEAASIDFTATVDDPAMIFFRWDLNNDGVWDTPWRLSLTMSDSIGGLYGDDYHDLIAVDFWDGISTTTITVNGTRVIVPLTVTQTAELNVFNAPPAVKASGPDFGEPGTPIEFAAYAEDPGSDDLVFTWNWGDGSVESRVYYNNGVSPDSSGSIDWNPISVADQATHAYDAPGTYTITLTVADDDGGSMSTTMTVTVGSPLGSIDDLIDYVEGQEIPKGIKTSLLAQLKNARKSLIQERENAAAHMLDVFAHHAGVLRKVGKLTEGQAGHMISSAKGIIEMIL